MTEEEKKINHLQSLLEQAMLQIQTLKELNKQLKLQIGELEKIIETQNL